MSDNSEQGQASTSADQELDVGSERFNPLRALYAADYKVTEKTPKVIYQNLASFETALKKFGIWQLNKTKKIDSEEATTSSKATPVVEYGVERRRFEPHQMAIAGTIKKKHQRNLYTHMAGMEGPLAALQKWLPALAEQQQRRRVRVLVRKEHSVAGSIEGELVAFDNQWNLLLKHAVETWKRRKFNYGEQKICGSPEDCSDRLRELGIALPSVEVKSMNRKNVELRRELPQLLVRGENVVLISLIST